MKYSAVLVYFFLLFTSCNSNTNTPVAKDTTIVKGISSKAIDSLTTESKHGPILDKATFAKNIRFYIDSVKNVLPTLSRREADQLYKKTQAYITDQITQLKGEEQLIEWYCEVADLKDQPDSIKKEIALYESVNLEAWDIGEGYLELRPVPDFFINIFGQFVSEDCRDYMKLKCSEDSVLFESDAALLISFEALAKRMINWENFIQQYPSSEWKTTAREKYNDYLSKYFIGEDNTPSFSSDKMEKDAATDYKNISEQYPNTLIGSLSRKFFAQFATKKSTSEERFRFVENAAKEILKK